MIILVPRESSSPGRSECWSAGLKIDGVFISASRFRRRRINGWMGRHVSLTTCVEIKFAKLHARLRGNVSAAFTRRFFGASRCLVTHWNDSSATWRKRSLACNHSIRRRLRGIAKLPAKIEKSNRFICSIADTGIFSSHRGATKRTLSQDKRWRCRPKICVR